MIRSRIVNRLDIPPHASKERVVHTLDGVEVAVDPQDLLKHCETLWAKVTASDVGTPDYLLGLDGGGIVPTIGLSIISGISYKLAYKLNLDLPQKIRFTEPHATRQDIFSYNIKSGDRIILVDDEIKTGETIRNAVIALKSNGVKVLSVVSLIEDGRYSARSKIESLEVTLLSLTVTR